MHRPGPFAGPALTAALLLSACGAGGETPSVAPAASSSVRPVLSLEELDAEPIERPEESVAVAFDRDAAGELLTRIPDDVDFDSHAVVCVFLGPRQTTGWSLDLRTASLQGGELRIRARETAPRSGTRDEVTYPADCGLLTRAALPPGELVVRADDTITDEFIAETVIEVPDTSTTP